MVSLFSCVGSAGEGLVLDTGLTQFVLTSSKFEAGLYVLLIQFCGVCFVIFSAPFYMLVYLYLISFFFPFLKPAVSLYFFHSLSLLSSDLSI